jgi:cytochrome c553
MFLTRIFSALALSAAAGMAASALAEPPVENTLAQRTLACTVCHGEQGRAGPDGYYPRLAGKPAGYLYNQLVNFREGRRHYALMTGLIDTLDDAYLQAIAGHFSSLSLPYPPPGPLSASAAEQARAEQLVNHGDKALGVPACKQCHGLALTGVNPATPGLLGLPGDYINAQIGGWRSGQRKTRTPDCMARIASRLSETDISIVARWLAAQPVPIPSKPADQPPARTADYLAIECANAP